MRCQEEGEEDDPPLVPRLGTRTGSTLLFSTTTRFSDMKQKRNYSFLTSRSIAKTSYTIRSSGVLLQTGRVFLMTFIVGVKSYMEVSNETSDRILRPHANAPYLHPLVELTCLTNSHSVGGGTWPICRQLSMLWSLSFIYKKGEVYARYCTGKFVLFSTKG